MDDNPVNDIDLPEMESPLYTAKYDYRAQGISKQFNEA